MTDINTILLIITAAAVIVAACAVVFPLLKRKGIDAPAALKAVEGVLVSADNIAEIFKTVFPTSIIANLADKIIGYAKTGVARAEQLYNINQITEAERKAEAKQFVYDALEHAGIERTDAIDKIVDGAVEAAVFALGHNGKSHDDGEGFGREIAV